MGKDKKLRVLIVKGGPITISETFITDIPKYAKFESVILHGLVPVEYGKSLSSGFNFLSKLLNQWYKLFKTTNYVYLFFLKRRIKKFKPDVVLAQYGTTAAEIYTLCRSMKIPMVIQFHGNDAHNEEVLNKYKKEYPAMLTDCAATVVVSNKMLEKAVALGAKPETTFLNPCGVDPERFHLSDHTENYFLTVGRFVEKKAPILTILSFSQYLKKFPDKRLVMIGDGPLLSTCRDLVTALKIEDQVTFLGGLSHQQVKDYVKNAFIFLQHSIVAQNGDSEGSPVALVEAGACGVPVISTRHAGIINIVLEGQTGLLVDEKDIEAMTEAMVTLTEDKELYQHIRSQSPAHIQESFSSQKLIGRLERILRWSVDRQQVKPEVEPEFWKSEVYDQ